MNTSEEKPSNSINTKSLIGGALSLGVIASAVVICFFGMKTFVAPIPQPTPTPEIQKTDEVDLKIRGNRSSRIYHLPGCPNYEDIALRNIVNFKTKEEAESKGYRMAKNCH